MSHTRYNCISLPPVGVSGLKSTWSPGSCMVGGPTICHPWLSMVPSHSALWLPVFQGQDQERGMCPFSCSTGENLFTWLCLLLQRQTYGAFRWVTLYLASLCCRGRRRQQTWGERIRSHPEMRCSVKFFPGNLSFIKII